VLFDAEAISSVLTVSVIAFTIFQNQTSQGFHRIRKKWEQLVWLGLPKETTSERRRLVENVPPANRFFCEVIHKLSEMNRITQCFSEGTEL
jgi:hypothetical protein